MEVTDPVWNSQEKWWEVSIIWDGCASLYTFNERSDADSFVRANQVHLNEMNRKEDG